MVSDKVFTTDGTQNIFSSDFEVISEDHLRVFLGATVVSRDDYDLINNAAVFHSPPTSGQTLTLQVGTTPADILSAPTDAGIVAANIADIQTLADIAGDISAVENIAGDVETVADNDTNVTTVATNINSVNTVASNINEVIVVANDLSEAISEVETVALDLQEATSEIEVVANSITNVDTVGTNIANVNTVAGISADVTSVAAIDTDVSAVAAIDSNVTTVAGIDTDVTTVAGISAAVSTVAADGTDIGTVAGVSADVQTVAGIASDVTAVANISSDIQEVQDELAAVQTVADDLTETVSEIETVAAHVTNIDTVGTNIANVNTVAGNTTNITTVAGISSNVTTVAGISTEVGTVATNITDVSKVADEIGTGLDVTVVANNISNVNATGSNITNVNTVATNISDINTVVTNLTDIQNADDNALLAEEYATKAEDVNVTGTSDYSAYHWAQKAAASSSAASGAAATAVGAITEDLTGFPNRTDSTIAFNEGTAQFSIAPVSTSFDMYYRGELITISTTLTKTITNTSGGRYIKYNPTTSQLEETTINGHPSLTEDLLVAYVFWDSTNSKAIIFGDERHGSARDTQWHLSQHLDIGAIWRSGGGLSYTLNNNDVTVDVGDITFADEDLVHHITDGTASTAYEQVLSGDAEIPAIYLSGTTVIETTPTTVPWVQGTATVRYNPLTAGSGTLTDTPNNYYVSYWLIATNDTRYPVKAIMGHYAHSNIANAELEQFDSYGFSVPELVPMYQVILRASSAAPSQCQIAAVYTLTSRQSTATSGFSASSHDNLTDRSISDQHPIGAITGLQTSLNSKAATTYVDTEVAEANSNALALAIALG